MANWHDQGKVPSTPWQRSTPSEVAEAELNLERCIQALRKRGEVGLHAELDRIYPGTRAGAKSQLDANGWTICKGGGRIHLGLGLISENLVSPDGIEYHVTRYLNPPQLDDSNTEQDDPSKHGVFPQTKFELPEK